MVALNKLFHVTYGNKLDANKLSRLPPRSGGVNLVGRSSQNHGVSATVARVPGVRPYGSGLITVALGGSKLLSAFVQEHAFYTAQNVAVLTPIHPMTFEQKLFACIAIRHNRFRYSAFGREANRTLRTLEIPDLASFPTWLSESDRSSIDSIQLAAVPDSGPELDTKGWKTFRYDEVFEVHKGYYNKKPPPAEGSSGIPFVGATDKQNGITSFISAESLKSYSRDGAIRPDEPSDRKLFKAPCITVSNNGSVGEAFYQATDFTCTHDVNPLSLKDKAVELSPALGIFICTVIRMEKYRWGYGRKWRPIRMPSSHIRLPVTASGQPAWAEMESFINSLPFSSQLAKP